ncbi:hypothetical protein ACFWOT_09110 [Streptomyces sp. NPDC058440]|uniref:hypothetical protein n=1 Tax=Streptomyces sp. NPDC058440 TaxID=3346501 RepID=UPI00364A2422
MAIGLIPQELANVAVLVEFTPNSAEYTVTLVDEKTGDSLTDSEYPGKVGKPFGYDPQVTDLDMAAYNALAHSEAFPAKLARGVAGFAFFEWYNPSTISRSAREKFGADK